MSSDWAHGLCGCFDNCGICIISYFVPCYTFGKNAEAVGDSCCLCGIASMVPVLDMFLGAQIRGKIRERRGIAGSFLGDLVLWCFCPLCALVQEAQEVAVMQGTGSMERE